MISPLVSIIMPIYKTEEYVEKAILSVEHQTYSNIELICINDGTPDSAFEICKRMGEQYENIVLLQNELHDVEGIGPTRNHGQEYTRNHGLEYAKGDYVVFLDSDDTLDEKTIEKLVTIAGKTNVDVVMFTYSTISHGVETPIYCKNIEEKIYSAAEFCKHILIDVSYPVLSCMGSKLYRLGFIKQNNIRFDKRYKFNEDAAFVFSCLSHSPTIYFLNQPYYKYLIRTSGSIMSSYRSNQLTSLLQTRRLLKKVICDNNSWMAIKDNYYSSIASLFITCIDNSISFGTSKEYNAVLNEILESEEIIELRKIDDGALCLSKNGRRLLSLILDNRRTMLYCLLRIKKCLKR